MKTKNNRINKFNCHPYLGAALVVDDKYLVLRSNSREVFAKQGYYFPGSELDEKLDDRKQLKNQLFFKYRLQVKVGKCLGVGTSQISKGKYCSLYLYRCALSGSTTISTANVYPSLFSAQELSSLKFLPPDNQLALRISIFDKVYRDVSRKTPLNEHDYLLSRLFYKCLAYNREKVEGQDIRDFENLLKMDSTIDEIEKAFVYISKRSDISLKEYIDLNKGLLRKEVLNS